MLIAALMIAGTAVSCRELEEMSTVPQNHKVEQQLPTDINQADREHGDQGNNMPPPDE
ncbi:hypothetical protein [Chryseobacterium sp. HMWF001]|uniref:hypothetical protein n=1 Tax=Chryseobacterium sp. HMWF001 TaxID=2056839 RepID=UPI0013FDD1C1|nr:hypothetical protein [Chryseobacterium sp. HMWF001]